MPFASAVSEVSSTSGPGQVERKRQDDFGKMVIILEGFGVKRRGTV